jgi:hypothetical protein
LLPLAAVSLKWCFEVATNLAESVPRLTRLFTQEAIALGPELALLLESNVQPPVQAGDGLESVVQPALSNFHQAYGFTTAPSVAVTTG